MDIVRPPIQETIDRDLRFILGDLQVQLIFARARIAELEGVLAQQAADAEIEQPKAPTKARPNGVAARDSAET
jgi:hypothetical protein